MKRHTRLDKKIHAYTCRFNETQRNLYAAKVLECRNKSEKFVIARCVLAGGHTSWYNESIRDLDAIVGLRNRGILETRPYGGDYLHYLV